LFIFEQTLAVTLPLYLEVGTSALYSRGPGLGCRPEDLVIAIPTKAFHFFPPCLQTNDGILPNRP